MGVPVLLGGVVAVLSCLGTAVAVAGLPPDSAPSRGFSGMSFVPLFAAVSAMGGTFAPAVTFIAVLGVAGFAWADCGESTLVTCNLLNCIFGGVLNLVAPLFLECGLAEKLYFGVEVLPGDLPGLFRS